MILNMLSENTIAAIATPLGTAGVGKIRVSGPKAIEVGNELFKRTLYTVTGEPFE
jgi:tRNA modification GTPase